MKRQVTKFLIIAFVGLALSLAAQTQTEEKPVGRLSGGCGCPFIGKGDSPTQLAGDESPPTEGEPQLPDLPGPVSIVCPEGFFVNAENVCQETPSPLPVNDFDGDGIPDSEDPDDDNDDIPDERDPCPLDDKNSCVPPPSVDDPDGDGIPGTADNCPTVANADQTNTDGAADGGDACDPDDDNDGAPDETDPCLLDPANGCVPPLDDSDGDGIPDTTDNCPAVANADQTNTDGAADGGDACDTDDDNDGTPDETDPCLLDPANRCLPPPPVTGCLSNADCPANSQCTVSTGVCTACGEGRIPTNQACLDCRPWTSGECDGTCPSGEFFFNGSCRTLSCSPTVTSDPWDRNDSAFNMASPAIREALIAGPASRIYFVSAEGTDGADSEPASCTLTRPCRTIGKATELIRGTQTAVCGDATGSGCNAILDDGAPFRILTLQGTYQENLLPALPHTQMLGGFKVTESDNSVCVKRDIIAVPKGGYKEIFTTHIRSADPERPVLSISPTNSGPANVTRSTVVDGFFISVESAACAEKSYAVTIRNASPTLSYNEIRGQVCRRAVSGGMIGPIRDATMNVTDVPLGIDLDNNIEVSEADRSGVAEVTAREFATITPTLLAIPHPTTVAGILMSGESRPLIEHNSIYGNTPESEADEAFFRPNESNAVRMEADSSESGDPLIRENTLDAGYAASVSHAIRMVYCQNARHGVRLVHNSLDAGDANATYGVHLTSNFTASERPEDCPVPLSGSGFGPVGEIIAIQYPVPRVILDRNLIRGTGGDAQKFDGVFIRGEGLRIVPESLVSSLTSHVVSNNLIDSRTMDRCRGILYSGGPVDFLQNTVDVRNCTATDSAAFETHDYEYNEEGRPLISFPPLFNNILLAGACSLRHLDLGVTGPGDYTNVTHIKNNILYPAQPAWNGRCRRINPSLVALGNFVAILPDSYFVNTDSNDYRLVPNTGAVNTGNATTADYKGILSPEDPDHVLDRDGVVRPVGSGFDRGAYESFIMMSAAIVDP